MKETAIVVDTLPELEQPVLIAGFDGWGNALNVSKGMVDYLVRQFNAEKIAVLDPDALYRYDEKRPWVKIEKGELIRISNPGGGFHAARTGPDQRDLVILSADEPSLGWHRFADQLFTLCRQLGIDTVVTLGSMFDNVLHWDRIISGIASDPDAMARLKQRDVVPIDYNGPTAIHSIIQAEGQRNGLLCLSLWCHCPYYLQDTIHFGLMATLGSLLASFFGFDLETANLEASWRQVEQQIHALVENNAELQSVIDKLKTTREKGSWEAMKHLLKKGDKVIDLKDFRKPPR